MQTPEKPARALLLHGEMFIEHLLDAGDMAVTGLQLPAL